MRAEVSTYGNCNDGKGLSSYVPCILKYDFCTHFFVLHQKTGNNRGGVNGFILHSSLLLCQGGLAYTKQIYVTVAV